MNDATEAGHKHPEAFCLMMYRCERCGQPEVLWNSRDGVTPFTLTCLICSGTMQHVNWKNDRYDPNYVPQPGQRYFIDLTKQEYFKFLRQRFPDWTKKDMNRAWRDDIEARGEPSPNIATAPPARPMSNEDFPVLSHEGAPLTRAERRRRMFNR